MNGYEKRLKVNHGGRKGEEEYRIRRAYIRPERRKRLLRGERESRRGDEKNRKLRSAECEKENR